MAVGIRRRATPTAPSQARRRIEPGSLRRRLPTRRAVTGAVLITVAAAGVLGAHRAASTPPEDSYVVVTSAVPAGHRLQASDLGTVAIDLPGGLAALPAEEAEGLVGRATRNALDELSLLSEGDLFEAGRFTDPSVVEVGLDLPTARALRGTIDVGDVVDVLVTDPDADGTRLVATARVAHVGGDDGERIGSSGTVQVRLGVADRDSAVAVVDASIRAEVSLALPAPDRGEAG